MATNCSLFNFESVNCTQVDVGFDYTKVLTYKDPSGTAIDITSFTFQMVIKENVGGSVLLTLDEVGDNLTTGLYIPNPTDGVINIQITDTDSNLISPASYPYEFTIVDSDSKRDIFMQGVIQFFDRGF